MLLGQVRGEVGLSWGLGSQKYRVCGLGADKGLGFGVDSCGFRV